MKGMGNRASGEQLSLSLFPLFNVSEVAYLWTSSTPLGAVGVIEDSVTPWA